MNVEEFKQMIELCFPVLAIMDDPNHNIVSFTITAYTKVLAEVFTYDEIMNDDEVLKRKLRNFEYKYHQALKIEIDKIGRGKR